MNVGLEERAEVASDLRVSLERSGLTQSDFARHLGTSATRLSTYLSGSTIPSAAIYLRACRLGAAFDHARQQGLMTPEDAAEAANRALADGDEDFALRMILQARDDLRANAIEPGEMRRVWERRARRIADDRFDTLFRVIVAHEFGEDAPEWASGARLEKEWIVIDPFRDADTVRAQTPDWLGRARIFIAERVLATA
ncbi:MAG: helix-turn-helix transcriptional regulator [Propionicimonas sp.]